MAGAECACASAPAPAPARIACSAAALAADFARSVVYERNAEGYTSACRVNGPERTLLAMLGDSDFAVAMQQFHLEPYGHVYEYITVFFCRIVLPHAWSEGHGWIGRSEGRRTRRRVVYVPAGAQLDLVDRPRGLSAFEEIAALFGTAFAGLEILRVPWVPYCNQRGNNGQKVTCCVSSGRMPPHLRFSLPLVTGFPGWSKPIGNLDARSGDLMRFAMRAGALGAAHDHALPFVRPRVVTWLLSGGSNKRLLANEGSLVAAVSSWLARHHPTTSRFRALDPESIPFAEEVRAVAESDVLIALFGSSLLNCRFLPPGGGIAGARAARGALHTRCPHACHSCRIDAPAHRLAGAEAGRGGALDLS